MDSYRTNSLAIPLHIRFPKLRSLQRSGRYIYNYPKLYLLCEKKDLDERTGKKKILVCHIFSHWLLLRFRLSSSRSTLSSSSRCLFLTALCVNLPQFVVDAANCIASISQMSRHGQENENASVSRQEVEARHAHLLIVNVNIHFS